MPTECSAERFDFGTVECRAVEAAFDGGWITSDAGALLVGATDRSIGMMDRFSSCFHDERRADLIEHEVTTLVGQRVFGIALGYEDLNDHDELRHDLLMAVLAGKLEALRGKSADSNAQQMDYNFHVEDDRISISERRRGSPIDKVVSELMIFVNSEWGKLLAEHKAAGIYRTQSGGKVKMSTVPGPHQGLGVAQYLWSSSPLRRYVDLINQRQITAVLRGETPPYAPNDPAIFAAMRDFDAAYAVYNEFQRGMERYWCLRWLLQEHVTLSKAQVLRDNLVKFEGIPLYVRVPSLPDLEMGSRVLLEIEGIDLIDNLVKASYKGPVEG